MVRRRSLSSSGEVFSTRGDKIHIFKQTCNFLFIIQTKNTSKNYRSELENIGSDIIDIFTSVVMENMPLVSRM